MQALDAAGLPVERRDRLIPGFGARRIDEITPEDIERLHARLVGSARTKNKLLTELHVGVFRRAERAFGLRSKPAARVEKLRERRRLEHQLVWSLT